MNGVRGVANKIEVKTKISTTDVKTKIEDARRITVFAQAERGAWAAPGVSRVIDHITVVP